MFSTLTEFRARPSAEPGHRARGLGRPEGLAAASPRRRPRPAGGPRPGLLSEFLASTKALVFGVATAIELVGDNIRGRPRARRDRHPAAPGGGGDPRRLGRHRPTPTRSSSAPRSARRPPSCRTPRARRCAASTTVTGGLANPLLSFVEDALGLDFTAGACRAARRGPAGVDPVPRLARALAAGLRSRPRDAAPSRVARPRDGRRVRPGPGPRGPAAHAKAVHPRGGGGRRSATAVVFDKSGKPMRGLGTKDVELFENGVKQEVYFREASSLQAMPRIASRSPSSSSSTRAAA